MKTYEQCGVGLVVNRRDLCRQGPRLAMLLLLIGAGLGPCAVSARAVESICASVKIEILQEATLERQAFDAEMKIDNGSTGKNLEQVRIDVLFQDGAGQPVLASSNPNDVNALFYIRQDRKSDITAVDGSGIVLPGKQAVIHWLIIPAPGAAGPEPKGTLYLVGAKLSYRLAGELREVDVSPDRIFVKPMPRLVLDYFLPNQVYGDDAFTEAIEPIVPFNLGVRVRNQGYGPALNFKIESAQPKIVENEQGLLVDFHIIQSEVNDEPSAPTLLINFGDIAPATASVGRWIMTCSLSGRFVSFGARYSHADELGGRMTSLMDSVNTHLLVRDVLVDLNGRDMVRDFLAWEGAQLRVYESDNIDTDVTDQSAQSLLQLVRHEGDRIMYQLQAPYTPGPMYVNLDFAGENKTVLSARRADGKQIDPANFWIAKSRTNGNDPWAYTMNLFDVNGGGVYEIVVGTVTLENHAPILDAIGDRVVKTNQNLSIHVHAVDPDDTLPVLMTSILPEGASFTDQGGGHGLFSWTPTGTQGGSMYPVRFIANDGEFIDQEIVKIYVQKEDEPPVWSAAIKDLAACSTVGSATVKWDTVSGFKYEFFSSDAPYVHSLSWSNQGAVVEGLGMNRQPYEDTRLGTNLSLRFYQVVLSGDLPQSNGVWGIIRRDIREAGYTMMAPPVRTDRRFDGSFGRALAEQLQGSDGGIGSGGDEVYILEAEGTWRTLYLDTERVWRESTGEASTYELPVGRGLWVARKAGTPARITFTGPVGNDGTQKVTLQPGFNLIGLSEGKSLPLKTTFAAVNPLGAASEEEADQVVFQEADGSWRRLMYVEGWGAPYDGNWFDLSTFQIVSTNELLDPGAAYYYLRRGDAVDAEF